MQNQFAFAGETYNAFIIENVATVGEYVKAYFWHWNGKINLNAVFNRGA